MSEPKIERRDLLKLGAAVITAAATGQAQTSHQFFTPDEWKMTDELTEIVIPTDSVSPGARAAKVADYIDARLAEEFDDEDRTGWRSGLASVDQLSLKINKTGFLKATLKQREAVVLQMAANEKEPKEPYEVFFKTLKSYTVRGYHTSSIGIHKDMDYKGNVFQQGDYSGVLPSGPALSKVNGSE